MNKKSKKNVEEKTNKVEEISKQQSISTVNVIQLIGETDITVRSFPDTPEGNASAEEAFKGCMKENDDISDEDIPSYIEDGYWSIGTYQIFLVHSS
ncbi:MAG: hypothetical protein WC375_00145 [Methanomassiliicoccales archaeon]